MQSYSVVAVWKTRATSYDRGFGPSRPPDTACFVLTVFIAFRGEDLGGKYDNTVWYSLSEWNHQPICIQFLLQFRVDVTNCSRIESMIIAVLVYEMNALST